MSILLILFLNGAYGQTDDGLAFYKKIYTIADSLIKIGEIKKIDSAVFETAGALDKVHPAQFFQKGLELLAEYKFNEGSFIYYLGVMRYRYYNAVNPEYQRSGDGALLASLMYMVGDPVNMYLKTDTENFISIFSMAIHYVESHDFVFYSRTRDEEKYQQQIQRHKKMLADLEANKETYTAQWNEENAEMVKSLYKWTEEHKKKKLDVGENKEE